MTQQQLNAFKSAILAETAPELVALRNANNGQGDEEGMAAWYNTSTANYYIKRRLVSRHEILTGTSDDGTTFSWAAGAYITRSQGERDAFREMFNDTGTVDPWLPTIQAAFNDIFSGAGGLPNRTHITAMSRRLANRVEKALATGAGTKGAPSDASFEGLVNAQDISDALRS